MSVTYQRLQSATTEASVLPTQAFYDNLLEQCLMTMSML